MAEVTAVLVKELREKTGAGMMDCKRALDDSAGDIEAAVDWLRKKGLSAAAKKAGRVAAEGLIGVATRGPVGAVVEPSLCQMDTNERRIVDFRLPGLDGTMVSFHDIDADLILLDFWGSWCQQCWKSIPHLTELAKKYEGKARVIGVSVYETETEADKRLAAVRAFVDGMGEKIFGQVLNESPEMRPRIVLASKCGIRKPGEPQSDSPYRYARELYLRLLTQIGWKQDEATRALLPLVEGAVAGIRKRGAVAALTGPVRRGDAETVKRHLEAVDNGDLYRMLALVALEIAKKAGLDPAAARRTRRALTRNVAATRRRGRR